MMSLLISRAFVIIHWELDICLKFIKEMYHEVNRYWLTGQKVSMLRSLQIRKLEISIYSIQDGRRVLEEKLVRSLFKDFFLVCLVIFNAEESL